MTDAHVVSSNNKDALDYKLKLTTGVHVGAECPCRPGDVLLLGSSYDCDLVLSDEGIGDRHCVLRIGDDSVLVRPVGASVHVADRAIARGQAMNANAFEPIRLGTVELIFGAIDDPRWNQFDVASSSDPSQSPRPPAILKRYRLPLVAALVAGVALTVTLAISASHQQHAPAQSTRQHGLSELLATLGLREARVERDGMDRLRLVGVVPSNQILEELQRRAQPIDPDLGMQLRIGEDIAGNVREVLRLQEVRAEARYIGDGEVVVRGTFPDLAHVERALESPAMLDIPDLRNVSIENLAPEVAVEEAVPERAEFISVVMEPEPHLVGTDRSLYYIGAQLPGLGTLIAVDGQAIYIDTGHSTRVLLPRDYRIAAVTAPAQANGATRE